MPGVVDDGDVHLQMQRQLGVAPEIGRQRLRQPLLQILAQRVGQCDLLRGRRFEERRDDFRNRNDAIAQSFRQGL